MKRGFSMLVVLFVGAMGGACVRGAVDLVVRDAYAQPAHQYKVVGGSMSDDGYQQDLDKYSAAGWRLVAAIPNGQGPGKLVFER
jgi:hypothetical protein